jgi:hypothetical protein
MQEMHSSKDHDQVELKIKQSSLYPYTLGLERTEAIALGSGTLARWGASSPLSNEGTLQNPTSSTLCYSYEYNIKRKREKRLFPVVYKPSFSKTRIESRMTG